MSKNSREVLKKMREDRKAGYEPTYKPKVLEALRKAKEEYEKKHSKEEVAPQATATATESAVVSTTQAATQDASDKALAIIKNKLGTLNAGIDHEIMQAGMTLAGYHIEAGARTFAEYSAKMVEALGEGIRPYLKAFYLGVRNWPGFDAAGMDSEHDIEAAQKAATEKKGDVTNKEKKIGTENTSKAEFQATHELTDGAPVMATEEDEVHIDSKDNECEKPNADAMKDNAYLNSWGQQAKAQWREIRPNYYKALEKEGELREALIKAQERTANEMEQLEKAGLSHDMAWEMVRECYLFPPAEDDAWEEAPEGEDP